MSRRSSRLTGVTPHDYRECDGMLDASEGVGRGGKVRGNSRGWDEEVAYNPEVYTAVQREALGTCAAPWTLFVDGYEGSVRIYDKGPAGQCCHQCRQKTVCKHTSCESCGLKRGTFCGDCLMMRYGENVDEVLAAGSAWQCPPCRDLCNCSQCRQRKVGAAYT